MTPAHVQHAVQVPWFAAVLAVAALLLVLWGGWVVAAEVLRSVRPHDEDDDAST